MCLFLKHLSLFFINIEFFFCINYFDFAFASLRLIEKVNV